MKKLTLEDLNEKQFRLSLTAADTGWGWIKVLETCPDCGGDALIMKQGGYRRYEGLVRIIACTCGYRRKYKREPLTKEEICFGARH